VQVGFRIRAQLMYVQSESSENTLARGHPVFRHTDEMRSNNVSLKEWFELQMRMSKISGHFRRFQNIYWVEHRLLIIRNEGELKWHY